ncbi:MAG: nucleotidyltransferase domain-containing protein [Victivallales bacterium]
MQEIVKNRISELPTICERRGVIRLWLFGSAATESFDTETSDLDFLVEFRAMPPGARADHFFGLQEDLQTLFGMPVDLVEPGPIRNPYFIRSVEQTRVKLYEAA